MSLNHIHTLKRQFLYSLYYKTLSSSLDAIVKLLRGLLPDIATFALHAVQSFAPFSEDLQRRKEKKKFEICAFRYIKLNALNTKKCQDFCIILISNAFL